MKNIVRSKTVVRDKVINKMAELEEKKFYGKQKCEITWQDGKIRTIDTSVEERERIDE